MPCSRSWPSLATSVARAGSSRGRTGSSSWRCRAGILAEVRRVVDEELTSHQRRVFVAIVVDGIPLDALAAELGLRRNAIYKVIFDARRKIRRALVANGYLDESALERR